MIDWIGRDETYSKADATRPSLVADAEETVEDRRRRLSIDEEEPWEEEPARK